MNTQEIIEQYDQYVIANYGRAPIAIVKGQGARIWDAQGHEYLDMFPGWGVSGIGHCHPHVVEAIRQQAAELIHIDNTFYISQQGRLAQLISERSFGGKCFFCNSGAEAVEAALKLARRHTAAEKYKIITCEGGFHGRTMGAVTATAQPKYHQGFLPLVPGFTYIPFNDVGALEAAFDDEVAAVLVEPIQGEGGIRPADKAFLESIRQLCDQYQAVAIWDEVQTGMGRTGQWFGYQLTGVQPDIMTLAKSLGGGMALGAIAAKPEVAASLVPGTHASTFGGNPMACAAAIAVFEAIDNDDLLEHTRQMGKLAREQLEQLAQRHDAIDHIRGAGLMLGMQLRQPGAALASRCWEKGLRINCTQETVIRFMPPMTVTAEQISAAVAILDEAFAEVLSGATIG